MRLLNFIVSHQSIAKDPDCDFSNIQRNSQGYLYISFNFLDDWKNINKVITFYSDDGTESALLYTGAPIEIPSNILTSSYFGIKLTGVKKDLKITTNTLWIKQK